MEARLPAHLEVGALLRRVQAEGGFATILAKGERDAGTILVVCQENGANPRAFERMPQADGTRCWTRTQAHDSDDPWQFPQWLDRRRSQDPDLWIVELDIVAPERFIGLSAASG